MGGPNMMTKPGPVTGPVVPEVHLMLTPALGASKFVLPTAEALFVLGPSLLPIVISRSAIVIITAGDMKLLQVFIVVTVAFATHPELVTTVDHLCAGPTFLPVVIAGEAVKLVFCSTSSSTMLTAPHNLGFLRCFSLHKNGKTFVIDCASCSCSGHFLGLARLTRSEQTPTGVALRL